MELIKRYKDNERGVLREHVQQIDVACALDGEIDSAIAYLTGLRNELRESYGPDVKISIQPQVEAETSEDYYSPACSCYASVNDESYIYIERPETDEEWKLRVDKNKLARKKAKIARDKAKAKKLEADRAAYEELKAKLGEK